MSGFTAASPEVAEFVAAYDENAVLARPKGVPRPEMVVVERRKYLLVDEDRGHGSRCGLFMVDRLTGDVWDIRAYGSRGRWVGTLADLTEKYRAASATYRPEARIAVQERGSLATHWPTGWPTG